VRAKKADTKGRRGTNPTPNKIYGPWIFFHIKKVGWILREHLPCGWHQNYFFLYFWLISIVREFNHRSICDGHPPAFSFFLFGLAAVADRPLIVGLGEGGEKLSELNMHLHFEGRRQHFWSRLFERELATAVLVREK
jgi:hypothetical protein